ncbi:hypothetical protein [Pseudomonas sp. YL-218 TE3947]|jgi:hypothetical protein|uniref:hypothetical protein n=1 Tax=Pseudomonas TaxID=286 RepID=UPI003D23E4AD
MRWACQSVDLPLEGRMILTPIQKLIGLLSMILVLLASSAATTRKVQDRLYGKQLAEQAGLYQDDLDAISNTAAAQVCADQEKRLVRHSD